MSHLALPTANSMHFAAIAFHGSGDAAVVAAISAAHIAKYPYDEMKDHIDTIIVNVGILLDGSIKRSVEIWNADGGRQFKHLLITGYHGEKYSSTHLAQDVVCERFGIARPEGVHSQGRTQHTGSQAAWAAEKMKELGAKGAILVAPSFHITRKWLTVLEAIRRVEGGGQPRTLVIPVYLGEDMNAKILLDVAAEKEGGEKDDSSEYRTITPAEAVHGEHGRIIAYQNEKPDKTPGDCLSLFRLKLYQSWVEAVCMPITA